MTLALAFSVIYAALNLAASLLQLLYSKSALKSYFRFPQHSNVAWEPFAYSRQNGFKSQSPAIKPLTRSWQAARSSSTYLINHFYAQSRFRSDLSLCIPILCRHSDSTSGAHNHVLVEKQSPVPSGRMRSTYYILYIALFTVQSWYITERHLASAGAENASSLLDSSERITQ